MKLVASAVVLLVSCANVSLGSACLAEDAGVSGSVGADASKALTLNEEIDAYLVEMKTGHPPDVSLAYELAAYGKEIAPILEDRIKGASTEMAQVDLIRVFAAMHTLGSYSVARDHQLIGFLERVVGSMKDDFWRKEGARYLAKIRGDEPDEE